jgi:hypothetical protein
VIQRHIAAIIAPMLAGKSTYFDSHTFSETGVLDVDSIRQLAFDQTQEAQLQALSKAEDWAAYSAIYNTGLNAVLDSAPDNSLPRIILIHSAFDAEALGLDVKAAVLVGPGTFWMRLAKRLRQQGLANDPLLVPAETAKLATQNRLDVINWLIDNTSTPVFKTIEEAVQHVKGLPT